MKVAFHAFSVRLLARRLGLFFSICSFHVSVFSFFFSSHGFVSLVWSVLSYLVCLLLLSILWRERKKQVVGFCRFSAYWYE